MVKKEHKNTISLKEFFESKKELAIHCWNEKQAKVLLNKFDEMGKKWISGNSYKDFTYFEEYNELTCYLNKYVYSNVVNRKEVGTRIYEFKDIEDFKGIYSADGTYLNKTYLKKQILDEVEKKYLFGVIKPFIKNVEYIKKLCVFGKYSIYISLENGKCIPLPTFDKNSPMYKGMELSKKYNLEELGLVERNKNHE